MMDITKELIKSYANLPINEKRKELGKELSSSIILVYKLLNDITNQNNLPNIDEFSNLYNGNISESEYLTGFYEDFINYKELLAIFLEKITEGKYE